MNKLLIKLAIKYDLLRSFRDKRAVRLYNYFRRYLSSKGRIIEIGGGSCDIANILIHDGYKVKVVDIQDLSLFKQIKPIIYNGVNIPFSDKSFDVALLVTVLHHIHKSEIVLKEAQRVAKKVIIVEEVYKDNLQKYLTFLMDSITNLEFIGHPHSNKTDLEWKSQFKKMNLNLIDSTYERFWLFFTQATYILGT